MAGRPTKRTPELEAKLLEVLAAGNTRKTACDVVGIDQRNFERWMVRFAAFAEAVKRAESDAIAERVSRIRLAGIGGAVLKRTTVSKVTQDGQETVTTTEEYTRPEWTADAWLLERKYPQDWGRRELVDISLIKQRVEELADERGLSAADKQRAVAAVERMVRGLGRAGGS